MAQINAIRIACIGDVVGSTGVGMFQRHIPRLRKERSIDIVIVNGENSASDGRGITSRVMNSLRHNGADVVTSGNHIWAKREIYEYLDQHTDLIRPLNYPQGVPGSGFTFVNIAGYVVAVVNLQGRVFMRELVTCPFKSIDSVLSYIKSKASIIVIDMHAEATSEKQAIGFYCDGKVSAIVGTHTHVQTADERILPQGTAFITDLGMTGSLDSMLGMKKEPVIQHFIQQLPTKFTVDTSLPLVMSGVIIDIDPHTGHAMHIERLRIYDHDLVIVQDA
jgi:metallophosphoesterase (TIGR00282 family)